MSGGYGFGQRLSGVDQYAEQTPPPSTGEDWESDESIKTSFNQGHKSKLINGGLGFRQTFYHQDSMPGADGILLATFLKPLKMTNDLWQTFSSTVQSCSNKHPWMQLPSCQFKICAMIFKIPTSRTESPIPEIPRQTFYHQDSMPGVDGNIYGIISPYLWPLIKIVGGPNS